MFKVKKLAAVGATVAALLLAGCGGGGDPLGQQNSAAPTATEAGGPIVVGSANFTESAIIAEIYSQALAAKGVESSTKLNIGSREVYIQALQESSISVVPEYTGNLLDFVDKDTTAKSPEEVEAALPDALPEGLQVLKSSTAVDQDVYVVSKQFSEQNGVTSIADLAKLTDGVTVAGFSELEQRDYGPKGLTSVYGVKVKEFKPYDSAELMAEELNKGNIDVADLFTTASAIGRNQLVQLEDPKQMILPQNVIPLVRSEVAQNATATAALDAVQAALTTEDLIALNSKVDDDNQDPDQVAKEWLTSKGLA
ncbi:MAG TPA: ABC transporter substrate-binding protein [Propionibacteriaceae bacterium]|nr:ABC transporter substrate-binding protein [Propionibacteriaceae bacterium]